MKTKLTIKTVSALEPTDKPFEVRDTEIKGFLLRVQPSGAMTYYLAYKPQNGKKNRYRIGRHGNLTATQARDVAEKLMGKVAHGVDLQVEKKASKVEAESLAMRSLMVFLTERYGPWAESHRKTGKDTIRRINTNFSHLMDRSLDEITPWIIEKWRTTRLKDGIAHSSVNRDTAALKGVLSKAVEWGVIDVHPLSAIKPLKVDHSPNVRYLSESEEESLRRALIDRETQFRASRESANKWRRERGREELPDISDTPFVDHLRPIVLLAINTGMRRGEIFNLGWGDVDLVSNMVTIKGKKSKSGHTRYVPLNDEVRETLLLWKGMSGGSGLVFPSKDGNPLDNVRRAWGTALEMAEITDFRFHDLRHHFASRLVMEGTDLNTVRELLGHSDIKMTLRYAHLSPEHKAEAVARLVRNR